MCAFCYLYEIEFEGEGFLAVVSRPKAVMERVKCKCKCEKSDFEQFKGNPQCKKCEHFVIGKTR